MTRPAPTSSSAMSTPPSPLALRFAKTPPRDILIVMLSAIGDAVQVLPVANALKRHWPETRIHWLIQPVPHQLVRDHPAIDSFILFRRGRGLAAWKGFADVADQLRNRHFDLVLGLQVYFKAGILQFLAPSSVKLGFDRERARDFNWLVTTDRIAPHPPQHIQDQYFEFLHHLGIDPEPVEYGIALSGEERRARDRFLEEVRAPICSIVVGTSKEEKNWTVDGWVEVIEALPSRFGLRPVLVGGPSPVERAIADEILARTGGKAIDTLGNDLRRLVGILSGSRLVISPDTGPLHIARALEVPVVGLYGYTDPRRSGPYRLYRGLTVDGASTPLPLGEAPRYRPDGMRGVTPEAVLARVEEALRVHPAPPAAIAITPR